MEEIVRFTPTAGRTKKDMRLYCAKIRLHHPDVEDDNFVKNGKRYVIVKKDNTTKTISFKLALKLYSK